jgi:LDH2 family malate/lactate/ureidoglycolate dehydrogenase
MLEGPSAHAAEVLCFADRIGRSSHGVANLDRIYLSRLRSGAIDAKAQPVVERSTPAATLVDGRQSMGLSTGVMAMDLAMERARSAGIGLTVVRNSSHLGCAGFFTDRAARQAMVGMAATNCGGQRIAPPPSGLAPMLGTNPISIGAPAGPHPPFVLDMSTTVVATSRIRQAARRGEEVPPGWLVGPDGSTVTDPNEFMEGRAQVAFLGGTEAAGAFKGYGLALAVDVLCGLLSGAAVGPGPLDEDGSSDKDIGHFFLAIDIASLRDPDAYATDAGSLFGNLLSSPARPGAQVRYPGEPEDQHRAESDSHGVTLERAVYDDLLAVVERHGLQAPEGVQEVAS